MRLTDEQRAAVAEAGHVCLVSCPGSGKTRVIVAKLLHCIESVSDTTRRITCITHTNAAADEIDTRLRETCFGGEDLYYEVATIHGFALQDILRPFHHLLPELRNGFTILVSDADAYSEKARELMQEHGLGGFAYEEFERIQRAPDGNPSFVGALSSDVQAEWCAWLDANAYVTLNEIVYHAGRLVSLYPHIASALASRFAWILVDEFQDSSPGQILILKEIHKFGRTTFFCVGDPNQSIYGFAGASPELLTEFAAHIHANTAHRLTGNFRSSANICVHAELLCASEPPMRAVGEYAASPITPTHQTVADSAEGIFDHFLPAVRNLGVPLGKVAIFAAWWTSLFHLARELRRQNIPAIGPGARPYRRSHLISHLVEPIGAYLESPDSEIAIAVQRSLFMIIANLTDRAPYSVFDFRGRVVICKLLREASAARDTSDHAVDWVIDATGRFSRILVEAEMLSSDEATALQESAVQMVADIRGREGGDTLTVDDLGIFARPKDCIQLLTVHKAKGREFEAVAVIEAHDGRFPHFSVRHIVDDVERQAQYDEGRRVVYVATTRAKRVLMFFSDTADYRNRPTPFLEEMGL
jgi:DNA helicase II / ATP-dependent DNA helicase PcrA